MRKNQVTLMWPTYIGEFYNPKHDEIKKDLLKFFEDYKKNNENSRKGGTVHSPDDSIEKENYKIDQDLYMSKYDLHSEKNKTYQDLMSFISQGFIEMASKANETERKDLKFSKENLQVVINDSWFIDYKKGGFVLPHTHPRCSWNCVYYVQVGDDANPTNGSTFFQKSRPENHTNDFGSKYNEQTMLKLKPAEGKLVIWPQYVSHGSMPYEGSQNRIIVSANAVIKNPQ